KRVKIKQVDIVKTTDLFNIVHCIVSHDKANYNDDFVAMLRKYKKYSPHLVKYPLVINANLGHKLIPFVPFVPNESEMHRMAKEKIINWFRTDTDHCELRTYKCMIDGTVTLSLSIDHKCNCCLEYPVTVSPTIQSIDRLWNDEYVN